MKKVVVAWTLESSFWIGTIMMLTGAGIIGLWKLEFLGQAQQSLIFWGFQMALSGGLYMVAIPVARYTANIVLRNYHYPLAFVGLCVSAYTAASLWRVDELTFRNMSMFLLVPPLIFAIAVAVRIVKAKSKLEVT